MPSTFSINFMEAMQDITEMFGSTRQTDKLAFQENQDYDKLGEYEEIKITTMDDNHNRNYNMAARAISIMTICLCIVAAELLEMLIIILMILQFFGASIVCLRITFSACYVCCTLENQIFDSEKGFIPWNMKRNILSEMEIYAYNIGVFEQKPLTFGDDYERAPDKNQAGKQTGLSTQGIFVTFSAIGDTPQSGNQHFSKSVLESAQSSHVHTLDSQTTDNLIDTAATTSTETIPSQEPVTTAIPSPLTASSKPKGTFPRRACLVYNNEQYPLDHHLLSQSLATKYLVKVRTEIIPGRFMTKLQLHYANEDTVILDGRRHFRSNVNKTGNIIFSSDLESFSGHIQYPLPNKRATASRIGYGGNAIVFVVFHAGKEFAVKKTVYRSKEISVHSQLCHPNIINLEAVLVGEKHERHRDKCYVYCFMQKMDINFRNALSTKDHGCLKHLKMKLVEKRDQWETVLLNVKHVLRSVLKALDYMHGQGLVHRDVKASNILIKTTCQCSEVLYCSCQHKFIVQLGDFDSSATVPGYQLHLEEHQMIRYASVLPLGTMGYRAPEVSMHLVLSGPYEVLYTTGVDIWSFGCLLLAIFIGKSGPLKQRGEASLLLSAQDHLYSQELYHKIIKISELRKYYANVPGACDLAEKCLQVQPHCRPTAKELLQLDFFR